MTISLCKDLKTTVYEDKLLIFNPETGRTHCVDAAVYELLSFAKHHNSMTENEFIDNFAMHLAQENNDVFQNYLRDMIKQLNDLEIITLTSAS